MLNKERSFKELKYRFERIVLKNLFYVVVLFIGVELYRGNKMANLREQMEDVHKELVNNRNSYLAVDDEGIPITLPRTFVGAKNNEAIVAEALEKLIVSRANITDNFKISKFKSPIEIAEHSQSLSTFANEYIVLHENLLSSVKFDKEEWKKIIKDNESGLMYFKGYLTYLQDKIINNKLPHKLTVVDYKIAQYIHDGTSFKIILKVNEIIDTYAGQTSDGKALWDTKKGVSTIEADGYFDIRLRTKVDTKADLKGLNTKGLRFTKLKIEYAL